MIRVACAPATNQQWIQNLERENKLTVIKLTDGDYLRTLENAVQVNVDVGLGGKGGRGLASSMRDLSDLVAALEERCTG